MADFCVDWAASFGARSSSNGRTGREYFDATSLAAIAQRAAIVDAHVPAFTRRSSLAVVYRVVEDDPASDSSADGRVENVAKPARRAPASFREGSSIGIVVDSHRELDILPQFAQPKGNYASREDSAGSERLRPLDRVVRERRFQCSEFLPASDAVIESIASKTACSPASAVPFAIIGVRLCARIFAVAIDNPSGDLRSPNVDTQILDRHPACSPLLRHLSLRRVCKLHFDGLDLVRLRRNFETLSLTDSTPAALFHQVRLDC